MADAFTVLIGSLNTITDLLLLVVMLVSLAMMAYPDPSVRNNGMIAFLITLLAAILTNLPITVV